MSGELELQKLLRKMNSVLNQGEYVFISLKDIKGMKNEDVLCQFKETEGYTFIIKKEVADKKGFSYEFVSSWITLNIHSSLSAIGFTAAISAELAKHNISCNVIAAFYHDHLFVDVKDGIRAVEILKGVKKRKPPR